MIDSFPSPNSSVSNYSVASPQIQKQGPTQYLHSQTSSQTNQYTDLVDQPSFSPFPPLRKRSTNVPPSDEEKERILENARAQVLKSDDPEMQLSWAQDTLAYVEIASQNEARVSEHQSARPQTPLIEHQLRVDATNVVSFLADQHHPKAEFMKGMWLEFGKFGIRLDKKEAFRCYQRASQRGYARAEYRMGMQFESSNEPIKALKHYMLGVQAGDTASNYVRFFWDQDRCGQSVVVEANVLQRLGMMVLLGQHGQRMNYERGVQLISYSAQTADENAPQGAFVRQKVPRPLAMTDFSTDLWHATSPRIGPNQSARAVLTFEYLRCSFQHREGRVPGFCQSPGENGRCVRALSAWMRFRPCSFASL